MATLQARKSSSWTTDGCACRGFVIMLAVGNAECPHVA